VVAAEEEWVPAWYDRPLERNDLAGWRAACRADSAQAPGLAGLTFREYRNDRRAEELVC